MSLLPPPLRLNMSGQNSSQVLSRGVLKKIAEETLQAIEAGSYALKSRSLTGVFKDEPFDLRASVERLKERTVYYGPNVLSSWHQSQSEVPMEPPSKTRFWVVDKTTLESARWLLDKVASTPASASAGSTGHKADARTTIGILNFASAKKPGGGFLNGAQAQEESIARSSTLYPSLLSPAAQQFYAHHHSITHGKNDGYYSHAMIYSPSVIVFRDDKGDWLRPYEVDVLTSPAVNAGTIRYKRQRALERGENPKSEAETEDTIRTIMRERMARVLYLFEMRGVRNLVLGSFGTGVFKNKVRMVVDLWSELLVGKDARFAESFERVVFGVIGHGTRLQFEQEFGTETG